MSLAEKSDGILETYVQWEDIEEEMQKALTTTATFGPNKTVKNIGEGNGFLSRIALIRPDWQGECAGLPESFIAKICTAITMIDFSAKTGGDFESTTIIQKMLEICATIHNSEVDTYNLLFKYSEGRIPLPKIYSTRKFSDENTTKGFIIMEYFEDLAPCHIVDNVNIEDMKKGLRSVAIWQGIGLKMTEEERSLYSTTFLGDNFGDVFTPSMIDQFKTRLETFCGQEHVEIIDQFHKLMLKLCNKEKYGKLDSVPDKLGCKRVLCHGDLWSANILWARTDDTLDIRAFIDFQATNFGSSAGDLVRFFSSCLSGPDRRNHYKELLAVFYDYLREEVDGEMPYTLEQLEQSYRYFEPHGAFAIVPMIDSVYNCIAAEQPESCSTDTKSALIEKCVALIEDAVNSYREHPYD